MFVAQTKSDTVDGMCVDCAGNVYAGTSNGVEIYSPTGTLYRDGSDWRIFELHVRGY
jgi:sugar lactone lactonase YvrE